MVVQSKKVYVNSSSTSRLSGNNSTFSHHVPIRSGENFKWVSVLQAMIPKSYYLIEDGRNTFTLEENTGSPSSTTITVPAGSYTRRSLQSQMETLLNDNSPNGWTYTVGYNDTTIDPNIAKYDFSVSGNTAQPTFQFTDNLVPPTLGFTNGNFDFVGDVLNSPNTISLQREFSLFLHSDIVSPQNGTDILQDIYGAEDPNYNAIVWQNPDVIHNAQPLSTSKSSMFNFRLTDDRGIEIDLNGQNLVITLYLF